MIYHYLATSPEGFVQQLATCYLTHGYYFFVQGVVPPGKDPRQVDRKLLEKYEIALTSAQRYYRKRQGRASIHYLRHEYQWIMVATHGVHRWWDEHHDEDRHRSQVKDARLVPIHFLGYSIRIRKGNFLRKRLEEPQARVDGRLRVRVLIGAKSYRLLKAELLELATRRSAEYLAARLNNVPFEPYAPIRKQLLALLRMINARRTAAGLSRVPVACIRMRRKIVRPFDVVSLAEAA